MKTLNYYLFLLICFVLAVCQSLLTFLKKNFSRNIPTCKNQSKYFSFYPGEKNSLKAKKDSISIPKATWIYFFKSFSYPWNVNFDKILKTKLSFLQGALIQVECSDNGNDFSLPVPSPFLKLNDNYVQSFLSGYPIFWSQLFCFRVPKMSVIFRSTRK